MSKSIVSASAIGLPSRRLFMASGPAAAVFFSLRKAVAAQSPLLALIDRHKAAWREFEGACARCDLGDEDSHRPDLEAERLQARVHEEGLALKILALPAKIPLEAKAKVAHLEWYFDKCDPTEEQVRALLRSLVA